MAELVNRDRAKEKLPPLAYYPKLAAVARAHCQDMKDHGFFDHDSPRTGRSNDRVAKARIPYRAVGENLAHGRDVETAEFLLMQSPKHRANILNTDFTHIGIGVLPSGNGVLIVTQVFIRPPPVYDAKAVQAQILEDINKARLAKGLRRLVAEEQLMRQALLHSQRADRIGKPDSTWLEDQLRMEKAPWRMHEAGFFLTDKVSDVVSSETAMGAPFDHIGVGVVQTALNSKWVGALWVTLICAQRK
jgi:hypothetical protein